MMDPNRLLRGMLNEIAPGVWYVPAMMANVYFVGQRGGPWVLIDAGVRATALRIREAATSAFGYGIRPEAIILTHGHFDHVGALSSLLRAWGTPVYAHRLELPYLTGQSDYPPPDPTVGGFMSQLSRLFPNRGSDFSGHVQVLTDDGSLPGMPGWRWIHTPGHAPGHISLFREQDRCLIAGDAVITIDQDHPAMLVTQKRVIRRPPSYFTQDWVAAAESVRKLAQLRPSVLATGHGLPMSGPEVASGLQSLADHFEAPAHGRYVREPARFDESGTRYVPPAPPDPVPGYLIGTAAAGLLVGLALSKRRGRKTLTER
jgi:glyoxylase-like metal-dependent hydrolase (beta-lactamase superfamily II)